MPQEDLLNASQFLEEPTANMDEAPQRVSDFDRVFNAPSTEPEVQTAADFLPKTWNIAGIDTGIDMSKTTAATLVGMGDGMLDLSHGLQQIFGKEETRRGLAAEQADINALYNDPRYGTSARIGQVGGFIADPIGVIVPLGKGKNLWDVAKIGAATGTAFAGLGYVDEEAGQTRGGNALMGMVTGGVMSPALFGVARGVAGAGGAMQERAATSLLNTYKKQYWQKIQNGANPENASKFAMEQMGWTTADKVRLVQASRKPFDMEKATVVGYNAEKNKFHYDLLQADRNLEAMDNKLITDASNYLEQYSIGRDAKKIAKDVGSMMSSAIVPMATRVAKIDPTLSRELISFEARMKQEQIQLHTKVFGFNKALRDMGSDASEEIRYFMQNGQLTKARERFLAQGGKMKDWDATRNVIDKLYKEANAAGLKLPKLDNYFPRRVKDLEGLANHQNANYTAEIARLKQKLGREPSEKEFSQMLANIKNPSHGGRFKTGGSLLTRHKEILEQEESKFYHDTESTLTSYINDMVSDTARSNFFKKLGVKKSEFALDGSDVTDTIDDVIRKGRNAGKYGEGDVEELTNLLRSRFTSGETAPRDAVQAFKNVTYIATLGNFKSAMTQIGDLAFAAHKNGITNVSLELMNRIPGLRRIIKNSHTRVTKEQVGLEEAIQEFAGDRNGKAALDWILQKTQFKRMDRLGKETFINSHIRKVKNRLNSKKFGEQEAAQLKHKWEPVFGNETDQMIKDLSNGKFSDNVAVYLFNQLEGVQPIALSSMPKPYLDNPNGRIFYMLKSFTIKQLDLMRRDIIDEMARGNAPEAFKNLASLGTLFVMANGSADMLKDFMSGKEVEMEDTLIDNIWKLMGLNRYTAGKLKDTPGQAIIDTLAPPLTVYDRAVRGMGDPLKLYEASPFNGTQAMADLFTDGGFSRTDTNEYYNQLGKTHSTFDEE